MSRILFLTQRMVQGYGVSMVVANLARDLSKRGHAVLIACSESDGRFADCEPVQVEEELAPVLALAQTWNADVVVAHTSPYFEMLPQMPATVKRIAWEHGDPTPSLFESGAHARQAVKDFKQLSVYPNVDEVIAISEFVAFDTGVPNAKIIYNGIDDLPAALSLRPSASSTRNPPLRIGTLMRMGPGEARYKGNALYIQIVTLLRAKGIDVQAFVAGRGRARDTESFKNAGIETLLNLSEQQKFDYLQSLDVFVSPSLWEGFNLPLAEAQALGTLGIAFDTGAHPEVTPFVFSGISDMISFLQACANNRALLQRHTHVSSKFVRSRFKWKSAALSFEQSLPAQTSGLARAVPFRLSRIYKIRIRISGLAAVVKTHGWRVFLNRIARRTARRLLDRISS